VRTTHRTGVEMEALTACAADALTVYDMCKALDRAMVVKEIRLLEKTGGVHGDFRSDGGWPAATPSKLSPSDPG
ncbi:MAG: hypothetical protein K6T30_06350, partial [Alicyclobacillus sp.]|nr:hypothetical protein [Alicyclobacillus sp.]